MKLSNICCISTWMGDRLSIASCGGSMHEPCIVGYGEILEKKYRILPQLYLAVKFNFRNISLNKFFDPRPF